MRIEPRPPETWTERISRWGDNAILYVSLPSLCMWVALKTEGQPFVARLLMAAAPLAVAHTAHIRGKESGRREVAQELKRLSSAHSPSAAAAIRARISPSTAPAPRGRTEGEK